MTQPPFQQYPAQQPGAGPGYGPPGPDYSGASVPGYAMEAPPPTEVTFPVDEERLLAMGLPEVEARLRGLGELYRLYARLRASKITVAKMVRAVTAEQEVVGREVVATGTAADVQPAGGGHAVFDGESRPTGALDTAAQTEAGVRAPEGTFNGFVDVNSRTGSSAVETGVIPRLDEDGQPVGPAEPAHHVAPPVSSGWFGGPTTAAPEAMPTAAELALRQAAARGHTDYRLPPAASAAATFGPRDDDNSPDAVEARRLRDWHVQSERGAAVPVGEAVHPVYAPTAAQPLVAAPAETRPAEELPPFEVPRGDPRFADLCNDVLAIDGELARYNSYGQDALFRTYVEERVRPQKLRGHGIGAPEDYAKYVTEQRIQHLGVTDEQYAANVATLGRNLAMADAELRAALISAGYTVHPNQRLIIPR